MRGQRVVGRAVVARRAVGRQHEELVEVEPSCRGRPAVGDQALPELRRRGSAASCDRWRQLAQFLPRPGRRRTASGSRARTGSRCPGPWSAAGRRRPWRSRPWQNSMTRRYRSGRRSTVVRPKLTGRPLAAADLAHPRDLGPGVGRARSSSRSPRRIAPSNTPVPARPSTSANASSSSAAGVRAGHRAAVGHAVQERAAGREAERAGRHRLLEQRRTSRRCRRPCRLRRRARARPSRTCAARSGRRGRRR